MNRFAIIAAAVAAALQAVPAEATVFIFDAIGTGGTVVGSVSSTFAATAQGSFRFDATPGASSFTQTFISGGYISIHGEVNGDSLTLDYLALSGPGGIYQERMTLGLTFETGYLTSTFPTSVDYQHLVSGGVSYSQQFTPTQINTFNGTLYGLSSYPTPSPNPIATIAVTPGVPEASTWAMLLMGFGGLGYAMRRRATTSLCISFA